LPTKGVAGPYNQIELQKTPLLGPIVAKAPIPLVLPLEKGQNNGKHSFIQMQSLLANYQMTSGQVKAISNVIDKDHSNLFYQSRECGGQRVD